MTSLEVRGRGPKGRLLSALLWLLIQHAAPVLARPTRAYRQLMTSSEVRGGHRGGGRRACLMPRHDHVAASLHWRSLNLTTSLEVSRGLGGIGGRGWGLWLWRAA